MKNKIFIYVIIIFLLIVIDQFTKNLAINLISKSNDNYISLTPFLNIVLVQNKGVTFGIFNNIKYGNIIFSLIGIIAITILFFWFKKDNNNITKLAISFIISGAIGNVIDRIKYGAVTDFLDFYIKDYHWYSFNIADSAICIGVIILLYENFKSDFNKKLINEK
ncbi:MAG: signal peptidase II [Alphaproteobacteria bacterium]